MLFDLYKAFDQTKSHNSEFLSPKGPIFFNACATCSELLSNISLMVTYIYTAYDLGLYMYIGYDMIFTCDG